MSVAPVDRRNEQQPPAPSTEFGSFSGAFAKATASLSDFKQAGPNDMAPSIDQFTAIGKPGANGAGTITYETKDGAKVTVSENTNPSLYNAVVQSGQTLSGLGGSVAKLLDTAGGGTPPSSAENDAISEDLAKALSDLGGQSGGGSAKPGGPTPLAPTDDQVTTDLTKILGDVSQALGNPSGAPSAPPADAKTLAAVAPAGAAPADLTQAFTTALNSLTDPSGSSALRTALSTLPDNAGVPADQKPQVALADAQSPPAGGLDVQADLAQALKTVGGQAGPSPALSQVASELGQAFNTALTAANSPATQDDGKGAALPKALNLTAEAPTPPATDDANAALESARIGLATAAAPPSDTTALDQVKDTFNAALTAAGTAMVPDDGKGAALPKALNLTAEAPTPPATDDANAALESARVGLATVAAPPSDTTALDQVKDTFNAALTAAGVPASSGAALPKAVNLTAEIPTPPATGDVKTALESATADLTVRTDAAGNQPPAPPAPTGAVNLAVTPGASPPPPSTGPLANVKILEAGSVAFPTPAASPPAPPPPPVAAPSSTPAASPPPPASANGAAGDASDSLTPPANVTDKDAITKAQGQGYTVATASTTLGPNEAVSANPPPQATSQNTIQFQTTSGQKLVVDKNTNSALYNQAFNTAYNTNFQANWNAEQNAASQGYTVATKDTKLADGDSISTTPPPAVVGNSLMQFQTASGQKIIVDKNTNSDLYNQAYNAAYNTNFNANYNADFNANFAAVNNAVASGYTKADANTTIASGDGIATNPPPTEISNESITFQTNSGQKIVVDKNTNSGLYNQVYNAAFNANFNTQFNANFNNAISQGYVPATASTTIASGDAISTTPPPTALSNSIMLFTTNAGQKVMVSKDVNSDLYNQAYNAAFNTNFNNNFNSNAAATASSDKESQIAQAQGQGYTLANAQTTIGSGDAIGTNPPPQGIGTDLIQFQTNSGQKILVDKDTNPDLYNQAYNVYYNNANPSDGAVDTSQIDNSAEAQKTVGNWGTLAGNTSGTPTQEQLDLNRPLAAAQMLSDNWNAWGMHNGVSFSNPPSTLPPEAQACLKYISQNPSLLSALDQGGAKGSGNDGVIQLNNVNTFIGSTQSNLTTATSSYSTYLKNSPNAEAGGPAQQMAQSAALLQANQQLAYASTPTVLNGQASNPTGSKDPTMDADSLSSLANNSGLSPALTGAAKMWSQSGMFHNLDTAGNNPATASVDGLANSQNFTDFLTKQAPATDNDALTLLNASATRNTVAGVDTSKLGPDVLANPQNYTGQQKAAVLVQLTDQETRLAAGIAEGLHQPDGNGNMPGGLNPDGTQVMTQLQSAITQLSNDPDVAGFLSSTKGPALQNIVGSDPQMKGAVQSYSDKVNDGSALNDQINQLKGQKDSKGNPVPMGVALQNFAAGAATANQALGGDGNVDLAAAAAAKSGQLPAIQQYYQDQIVTGNELSTDIANGTDPDAAAQKFGADTAAAQALLGPNANAAQAATAQQNATQIYQDGVLSTGDISSFDISLGTGNGQNNLDPQKLTDVLNQAEQNDPSLMTDSAGDPIKPTDIAGLVNSVMGEVRNGSKIPDALNKVMKQFTDSPGNLNVPAAYSQGLFHLLSAVTTGAVLGARVASFNGTQTATAGEVAAGLQIGGYLGEGGTKYAKANMPKPPVLNNGTMTPDSIGPDGKVTPGSVTGADFTGPDPKPPAYTSAQVETLGNAFKTLGGTGSLIGGVVGILGGVGQLQSGDKVGGGFSITSGVLGVANAVGSLVEGGSGLLGGLGVVGADAAAGVGAVAGVVGGVAGAIGAVVGIVGDLVDIIKEAVDWNKEEGSYRSQIGTLSQYGITGGQGGNYDPDYAPVDE